MSEFVVVSDPRPAVRLIALNRPEKKNALTRAMYDALAIALRAADADSTVRVVCLTGSGDAFTAGNDIADFQSGPPPVSDEVGPGGFIAAVAGMEKPVIAAVNGLAVGIGTTILLHCCSGRRPVPAALRQSRHRAGSRLDHHPARDAR